MRVQILDSVVTIHLSNDVSARLLADVSAHLLVDFSAHLLADVSVVFLIGVGRTMQMRKSLGFCQVFLLDLRN